MATVALNEVPEVIENINGVNGVNGVNGTNGVNGMNGVNGVNGINGVNGVNGVNRINGVNGVDGAGKVTNAAKDYPDMDRFNSTNNQRDIIDQGDGRRFNKLDRLDVPNGLNGTNRVSGNATQNGPNPTKWHHSSIDHKNHVMSPAESTAQAKQNKQDMEPASHDVGAHLPAIAIVGIGLRLPGSIKSTDDFWDLLIRKASTRCTVPKDRYNVDAFYSASGKPGTVNSLYGHYLDCELDRMDASFFSMSKTEVENLDPQQRLLLEVIWECMESGGQKNWRGTDTGVYVGVYGDDWADLSSKDPQHIPMYRVTSSTEFALANRVSYEFDLKGPRYVLLA